MDRYSRNIHPKDLESLKDNLSSMGGKSLFDSTEKDKSQAKT
jgi:hypothetical protein